MVQVAIKPLTRKGINVSILMCLRDARFKNFKDSILGMITASLYDGPIYFNCYPNLTLALDDPNIVKALTLNIDLSGYPMEEGSKPLALIYRIYYRLLGTQLNLVDKINREPTVENYQQYLYQKEKPIDWIHLHPCALLVHYHIAVYQGFYQFLIVTILV